VEGYSKNREPNFHFVAEFFSSRKRSRKRERRKCRSDLGFLLDKKLPVLPENYCKTGRIFEVSASCNYTLTDCKHMQNPLKIHIGMGFDNTRE
jgi:hypothetical protein